MRALAAMGIAVEDDLTQEEADAEFYRSMQKRVAEGKRLP